MVVLLVLVAGVFISMMVERHGAQSLTVQRELKLYTFDHVSRGIGEAVEAWIKSNGLNPVKAALGENGHAFDLEVEGGRSVRISLYEAQGTVLADFAGLSGPSLAAAQSIVESLVEQTGRDAPRHTRFHGPVAVSVNSADREVLRAVAAAVLEPSDADSLASEILRSRGDGDLDQAALNEAMNRAEVPTESRAQITALLTAQPVLWRIIAEADSPGNVFPPRPAIRYGAYAIIVSTPGGGRDRSGSLQRNSSIIAWEDLSDR